MTEPAISPSVRALETLLDTATDALSPLMRLYRPYVRGLQNLPADGRFLLVGNHTQNSSEVLLIPYYVRSAIGTRVRPLADRQFGRMRGLQADLVTAYGAVVGTPDAAHRLMDQDETILVFPGGAREIAKYKGEEYTLSWQNRDGFARIAIEHGYPIVTAALVGGDDVYTSIVSRDSRLGRASRWLSHRLSGRSDMGMPLVRGIGPTLVPRPQRMYLSFGPPIATTPTEGEADDTWTAAVKGRVQRQLEAELEDLQQIRSTDPFRQLNPLSWPAALTP
ncbi:lysophospholipid acyltransferase family protein [Mycolicibacterium poriferae]|uniref:lysophospholipid acyltransferase family protein n=1 Tax=Mycolicibacterium poriferae TaxID=39694 RepID=UPI0024B94E16|nr:lysophospholipid acyltransferase family protein [Mycolicibacterium poriferae]